MRKFRILLAEVIGLGLLIGYLLWKNPELIEKIIPWVAFAVAWHITWEYGLDTELFRKAGLALGKRVNHMWVWVIVFLIGGSIGLLYWAGINRAIKSVTSLAVQRSETTNLIQDKKEQHRTEPTPPENKAPSPNKNASSLVNPLGNLVQLGWGVKEEYAQNLTTFEISNKSIPDMQESSSYFKMLHKPFALQLQQVPSISGLRFMAGINECIQITISASDVSDLSELRQLTNLRKLFITQTPFTLRTDLDVSPLASLINLDTLNLNNSRVSNVEALSRLTKLVTLNIGSSLVKDISPLKGLSLLKSLDVRDSQVTDVSTLSENSSLEELNVDGKQVSSLGGVKQIVSLMIISYTPFNTTAIGMLSSLKTLNIWGPPLIDLSPLRKLRQLTFLRIDGPGFTRGRAQVTDVNAIGELEELKSLSLSEVQISSLQFLVGHEYKNLAEFSLNDVPISSVSELASLVSLKKISFFDIPVVDIAPLLALPNLTEFSLLRVPARADVISELQRRGVKVTIN
jgi:Leucine-rich repeat (LRR) protein